MKFLQKLLPAFLFIAGALFFQSCEKEKTNNPDGKNSIVGKWNLTQWKGIIYQQGTVKQEIDVDITDPVIWTFNADGTGIASNIDGTGNFKYELTADNALKMEANNKTETLYYELSGTSLFIKSGKEKYVNDDGIEEEAESHMWFSKQ